MRRWSLAAAAAVVSSPAARRLRHRPGRRRRPDRRLAAVWHAGAVPARRRRTATSTGATGPLDDYRPVGCTELHVSETVHVGTCTEPTPRDRARPRLGRGTAAFQECSEKAAAFLGGAWRTGWLALNVVLARPRRAGPAAPAGSAAT